MRAGSSSNILGHSYVRLKLSRPEVAGLLIPFRSAGGAFYNTPRPLWPEFPTNVGDAQNLGFCLLEPVLYVPNHNLLLYRATQEAFVINRVRLCALDVSARVVERAFIKRCHVRK